MKTLKIYLYILLIPATISVLISCQSKASDSTPVKGTSKKLDAVAAKESEAAGVINDAATISKMKEVPILCYHQIRDWRPTDSKTAKAYIVPINAFQQQIKMLADSGYHTVLPEQVYSYLTKGTPLP